MNPLNDAASNGSSGRRSKRTLTSRFSSFLSRSSTHINNFAIELDDPLRQHGPGDTVKGTVVLNVAKPLGVTHVVACLYGYVQVFKNHSKGNNVPRHNTNRVVSGQNKRWVTEYYGDGFASLFEEEVVLCGEGRLDPKLYHFRFAIDFPTDIPLPSSIDFERGTIHYLVWSTVTRPNPIMSTTTCERKVFFRDHLDVGSLPGPKPREVTLRAVGHSSKSRSGLIRLTSYEKKRSSRASTMSKNNQSTRTLESKDGASVSRNPSISGPSSRSSSSSRERVASLMSELVSSQHSVSPKRNGVESDSPGRSITVSVEPSRTGCLPGDTVPVTVRVNHIKAVQSVRGVIVTCYRQARVDMHPNLPVVSNNRGRDAQFEDYYPRSRTGLGGLSLSAAGSSQAWRKDLSQSLAPLYIDPVTMSTEVKVSIRVPDDVFPSVRNVPGEMISFRYFIEVIIDIHGKLNTGDRPFPNAFNGQANYPNTPRPQNNENTDYLGVVMESDCFDTSAIRREKNAIVVQCDLLVGTRDSEKARGKRKALQEYAQSNGGEVDQFGESAHSNGLPPGSSEGTNWDGHDEYYEPWDQNGSYDNGHDYAHYPYAQDGYYDSNYDDYNYSGMNNGGAPEDYQAPRANFPLPSFEDDSNLSEKEQLRRAAERLLPSQPPDSDAAITTDEAQVPSAPVLPYDINAHIPPNYQQSASHDAQSFGPFPIRDRATNGITARTATPSMTELHRVVTVQNHEAIRTDATEDKQELERRRLQSQASAPNGEQGSPDNVGPSAPSAEAAEELEYADAAFDGSSRYTSRDLERLSPAPDPLPRYER